MLLENAREDAAQYIDTVFVPEMGIHPPEGQQEKVELIPFDVDGEVNQFLGNEKLKVLVIQGGGGSGKSLFCHIFSKKMLDEGQKEWIPVFINLPSLKDPLTQVIDEYLKTNRFEEKEI